MRELAIVVDERLGRRDGLEQALREAVRAGRLAIGAVLPSTRVLAADLGYSRATVVAAYEQLAAEGYLTSRQGAGTVVANVRSPEPEVPSPPPYGGAFAFDFRPGEPDTSAFPRQRWSNAARHVLKTATDDMLGYPDPRGAYGLRAALAEYLARSRAVVVTPDAISTFAGFSAAVGFLGELFKSRGIDEVAVEDPTLFVTRDLLRLVGVTPVPIPLDDHGISVDALRASGARAVLVTPAHQYPLGSTMSPGRRNELITWANQHDGWIVEDDYDGEFRYGRHPIGSLQGLDPTRVVYAGTSSKSLIPGLRLGWLVVPGALRGDLARVKHMRGATSVLDQLTLAEFIHRGHLDRHVRLARKTYRARQAALVQAVSNAAPGLHIEPQAAGLHTTLHLPSGTEERLLIRNAGESDIGLMGLEPHYATGPARQGLVLGFTRPPSHVFPLALAKLSELLSEHIS